MILDYILKVSINSTTIYKKNSCKHNDKVIGNNGKIQSYEVNSPKGYLSIKLPKSFSVPKNSNKLKFYSTFAVSHKKECLKQAYRKFFMSVKGYNKQKYVPKRFS